MQSKASAITTSDNTMTEVALALAMAFFSIMVLTMVSMGAGGLSADSSEKTRLSEVLELAPLAPATGETPADDKHGKTLSPDPGNIVIFDGARFLTATLDPLSLPWVPTGDGPVVLAVPPSFSLARASGVQAEFLRDYGPALSGRAVVMTMLDERWQEKLAQTSGN